MNYCQRSIKAKGQRLNKKKLLKHKSNNSNSRVSFLPTRHFILIKWESFNHKKTTISNFSRANKRLMSKIKRLRVLDDRLFIIPIILDTLILILLYRILMESQLNLDRLNQTSSYRQNLLEAKAETCIKYPSCYLDAIKLRDS